MSQLSDIQAAQRSLEESFTQRMAQLESQIQGCGPAKDTVAKVAEEFRTFRELMFNILGLLRNQIHECSMMVDTIETRHRRKALILTGITETENEDCRATVLGIIHSKLGLMNITAVAIKTCHRLGTFNKATQRPILLRFSDFDIRSAVWRAKTKLKGSPIAVKEFLTRSRLSIFLKARQHFGMRPCWTQEGVINVKAPGGARVKITSMEELNTLMAKHPKAAGSPASRIGEAGLGAAVGDKTALRR